MLRLYLTRDFAHHRRLVRIACPQSDGERIIDKRRIFTHIRDCACHIRIVFGEHANQHMTFRRRVDFPGVIFRTGQYVQANAIAVKVRGQFHACFS
ncbi:Uncharacterised protein [Salmonella enterica subsp. enterica serovar Bovismorbificans]|uniref:Uncharacterized protein n=1 Tax=Salmonella enterica subsp. enterica serovar Bovismorbificans TaxID=58097 RepID=A0A655D6C0_SALET|nr:Uncharacterised protein [Salmonella enterica subsp. enterica serovar Bovismorbificans]